MGDTKKKIEELMGNATAQFVYCATLAVVIIVILIMVWRMSSTMSSSGSEYFHGSGVVDRVFSSGATQRRLSQEQTGTNQGEYTVVHNAEIKELIPGVIPGPSERLVNQRGEPDFWEISAELDAYRSSQASGLASDTVTSGGADNTDDSNLDANGNLITPATSSSASEYLARDSAAGKYEQQWLTQMLYH